jgi:hypothetical protein
VFDYDQSLLFSSFVEAVFCDVIYVPLHSVNGKLLFLVCRALNCSHNAEKIRIKIIFVPLLIPGLFHFNVCVVSVLRWRFLR